MSRPAAVSAPRSPTGNHARVPPHNLAAEVSVLGPMLLSARAIGEVCALVDARDFYRGAHRSIFEAICAVHGRGEPADAVTVADELERRGQLGDVGGAVAIADILQAVPMAPTRSTMRASSPTRRSAGG